MYFMPWGRNVVALKSPRHKARAVAMRYPCHREVVMPAKACPRGNGGGHPIWIPACAGMTATVVRFRTIRPAIHINPCALRWPRACVLGRPFAHIAKRVMYDAMKGAARLE